MRPIPLIAIVVPAMLPLWACSEHQPIRPPSPPAGAEIPVQVGTCEVHNTPLFERRVPISYGLPAYVPPFDENPHNGSYILGGCVVMDEKDRLMPVCDKCTLAIRDWVIEKRNGPF